MQELQISKTPIDAITGYDANSRHHTEEQIELLKRSLTEYGWTNPILINSENVIVAGHARLQAAKELDMKFVPTIALENLTDVQVRAYRIADNRLAEMAFWDMPNLHDELIDLDDLDFDVDLTGFTDEYLEAIGIDEVDVTENQEYEPWDEEVENPRLIDKGRPDYTARRVFLNFRAEDETYESFMAWLESIEEKWTHLIDSNKRPITVWFPDRPEELNAAALEEDEMEEDGE